mgnify:CR=1 FL=1
MNYSIILLSLFFPTITSLLRYPNYGDHIYVTKHSLMGFVEYYSHHGIYVGNNYLLDSPEDYHIIHYSTNFSKNKIEKTSLNNFIQPYHIRDLKIMEYNTRFDLFSIYSKKPHPPDKTILLAHQQLNINNINYYNSEYFAIYCKTGNIYSPSI